MPVRELIASKVPHLIGREIAARAKSRGVSVSAYVAEILRQHVQGGPLTFSPQPLGLANANAKTRGRVARSGAKARNGGAK